MDSNANNETEDDVSLAKGNVQVTGGFLNGKFVQEGSLRPLTLGEDAGEVSNGTVGESTAPAPAVDMTNTVEEIRAELARKNVTVPSGVTAKADLLKLLG